MPSDFVVIGESVADIVRQPGRPDQVHPGGSPANVAYGLARLGRPTQLVTQLADDDNGRLIRDHLRGAGVLLTADGAAGVPEEPGKPGTAGESAGSVGPVARTPAAVVTLDAEGKAEYAFDIEWSLAGVTLPRPPRHLHTGSIAAVTEPGAAAVHRAAKRLRGTASVSYDPNVRPSLMGEHLWAVARVERCVALSDVVKASDEDLEWLYPGHSPERVATRWLALGAGLVLVTRGGRGALAFNARQRRGMPPRRVTVADTVGAGDAFMSGALHALADLGVLGARQRKQLAALHACALDEVLRCAGTSAALTVSRPGAAPPDAAELAAALRDPDAALP
jgi:fructokinase